MSSTTTTTISNTISNTIGTLGDDAEGIMEALIYRAAPWGDDGSPGADPVADYDIILPDDVSARRAALDDLATRAMDALGIDHVWIEIGQGGTWYMSHELSRHSTRDIERAVALLDAVEIDPYEPDVAAGLDGRMWAYRAEETGRYYCLHVEQVVDLGQRLASDPDAYSRWCAEDGHVEPQPEGWEPGDEV